jgi:hypothetical protein
MEKMKNEFLILFEKDDALLLSEGNMEIKKKKDTKNESKDENEDKKNKNEDKNITPVRNIDVTIKEDPKKKCLNFTIRRCF